jgi:hypothetical protein
MRCPPWPRADDLLAQLAVVVAEAGDPARIAAAVRASAAAVIASIRALSGCVGCPSVRLRVVA